MSSSSPNSALQVSSPSSNLLVTTPQPVTNHSVSSQAVNNSQAKSASNTSSTLPSRVSSNESNIALTSTNLDPESSGDEDTSIRVSGRSLDVGNTTNVNIEGSGNGTEVNGEEDQAVEGSSQASLNSSDINITNSTLDETALDDSNSRNITVSDNQGLDNEGEPTTDQVIESNSTPSTLHITSVASLTTSFDQNNDSVTSVTSNNRLANIMTNTSNNYTTSINNHSQLPQINSTTQTVSQTTAVNHGDSLNHSTPSNTSQNNRITEIENIDGGGDGSGDGSLLVTDTRDMLLRQEEVENQISSQNNVLPSCFLYRLPWSEINH